MGVTYQLEISKDSPSRAATVEAQTMLKSIKDLGMFGIIIGIIVQSLANIVPVPGEFITVILMEIYGPVRGGMTVNQICEITNVSRASLFRSYRKGTNNHSLFH